MEKLDENEHKQVFAILKRFTDSYTRTPTGVFVSTEHLSDECLTEIHSYVSFCLDQRTRMDEDMKTRKTYERMVGY